MPRDVYVNKFAEGLDVDSDDKIRKNTTYKDAHNVELTGDGTFGALKNLKGTTLVSNILTSISYSSINFMGAYEARTFIYNNTFSNSVIEDCIYLFYITDVSSVYTLHIDLFRPKSPAIYSIYAESVDSSLMSSVMDAFSSGEAGVDTIYYTITGLRLGRIKCVLNIANPTITERQTELLKRYPSNGLIVSDILYNPKSEAAASDLHTITLNQSSSINLTSYKNWIGTAPFDADTTAGDQFDVSVYYSLVLDGGASNTPAGHIYIYDTESGGVSQSIAQTVSAGGTYSSNGTRVISRSGVYNANPIKFELSIDTGSSSGYVFARAEITITAITETSGGDTYLRGTPISKTLQILIY